MLGHGRAPRAAFSAEQVPSPVSRYFSASLAVPERLAALRRELGEWARAAGMSEEGVASLALAAYEAMANAAEHAYRGARGIVEVSAVRGVAPARIEVEITDRGQWRLPLPGRNGVGGRGLVLARELSDECHVGTGPGGARVRMRWLLRRHSCGSER